MRLEVVTDAGSEIGGLVMLKLMSSAHAQGLASRVRDGVALRRFPLRAGAEAGVFRTSGRSVSPVAPR